MATLTERYPHLSTIAVRVLEAVEREHEPLYSACGSDFLAPVARALVMGRALVGRCRGGGVVAAYPDGRVTLDGVEVTLDVNAAEVLAARVELNVGDRSKRGTAWAPALRIPGDAFDVAYIFYALAGWQSTALIADLAMGCKDCNGTASVEVEGVGPGRLTVACSCQEFAEPVDPLPIPRPEVDLAREEAGAWFGSTALGAQRSAA